MTNTGEDVTEAFNKGAGVALALAQKHHCRFALLKEGSPSCGSLEIHDGTFQGKRIPGAGIATQALRAHGVRVFNEDQIEVLAAALSD